jgi:cupin fold WbuC family metalloprotein
MRIIQIDNQHFSDFKSRAKKSPRKRHLHLLHTSHEAFLHSMVNTFTKGTYAAPHRHYNYDKEGSLVQKGESFIALEGKGKIISFDDAGNVMEVVRLDASLQSMCWIPSTVWHTVVPDSEVFMVFENKTGPWEETTDKCFHPKFPKEGEEASVALLNEWERL